MFDCCVVLHTYNARMPLYVQQAIIEAESVGQSVGLIAIIVIDAKESKSPRACGEQRNHGIKRDALRPSSRPTLRRRLISVFERGVGWRNPVSHPREG